MKRHLRTRKPWIKFLVIVPIALSPLALVLACNKEAEVVVTPPTEVELLEVAASNYLVDQVARAEVDNNDFNTALSFNPLPQALPDNLAKVYQLQYSLNNFASETLAQNSEDALWTNTLPTQVAPIIEARYLWARLKSNDVTKGKSIVRDLTSTCGLREVKVQVKDLESFKAFKISDIEVTGLVDDAQVITNLGEELSSMLKVEFKLNDADYVDQASLQLLLKNSPNLDTRTALIRARILPIDQRYALSGDDLLQGLVNTDGLTSERRDIEDAARAFLVAFENRAMGTSAAISWDPSTLGQVPTMLSAYYETLQVAVSTSASVTGDAIPEENWSTALPTSINSDVNKRFLWVRLKTKDDTKVSTIVVSRTYTSGLRDLPSA